MITPGDGELVSDLAREAVERERHARVQMSRPEGQRGGLSGFWVDQLVLVTDVVCVWPLMAPSTKIADGTSAGTHARKAGRSQHRDRRATATRGGQRVRSGAERGTWDTRTQSGAKSKHESFNRLDYEG